MGRQIDLDDLIDVNGVAEILGLSHHNTVTTYLRRYPDMPRPILHFEKSRIRIWSRSEMERWAKSTGRQT